MENDDLIKAVAERHSVRRYNERPLEADTVNQLMELIGEYNKAGNLNMQLVIDEPRAFRGIFAYGKFYGVRNYIVVTGPSDETLDERCGYWGELLVLRAQLLGLNTCWVGLSYKKIPNTFNLKSGHKVVCYIAIGYGETKGVSHKIKRVDEVSNISESTPEWFDKGVEAVLLAPTAINQQKFYFNYNSDGTVTAQRRFSMVGYTKLDLGIAKRHFEIGAKEPVIWR